MLTKCFSYGECFATYVQGGLELEFIIMLFGAEHKTPMTPVLMCVLYNMTYEDYKIVKTTLNIFKSGKPEHFPILTVQSHMLGLCSL